MAYPLGGTDEFQSSGDPFDRSEAFGAALAMVSVDRRAKRPTRAGGLARACVDRVRAGLRHLVVR